MAVPGTSDDVIEVKRTFEPRLEWDSGVRNYLSQAYGAAKFQDICTALCRPSLYSCVRVNTLKATREDVMQKIGQPAIWSGGEGAGFEDAGPEFESLKMQFSLEGSPSAIRECGLLTKNRAQLPAVTPGRGRGPSAYSIEKHTLLPNVVLLRGQGPFEVKYVAASGGSLKEVVVSRKCGEAVLRGANVFVPGVLACSPHIEQGDVVAISVAVERPDGHGGWSVGLTRGTTLFSEHAKTQLDGCTRSGWFIGKGRAMMSRTSIFKEIEGLAVQMTERVYNLPPCNGLLKGKIFLQNLPSIVTAHVLDPQPGERILDMCAAPGGKTTAIALLMQDRGEVIALDRSHNKVRAINALTAEMALSCIRAYKVDALKSVQKEVTNKAETDEVSPQRPSQPVDQSDGSRVHTTQAAERQKSQKSASGRCQHVVEKANTSVSFPPRSFDRVLLDAPCSALGLRPRLFAGEETLDKLRKNGSFQRKLLDQAVQLLRPGGTLVYSTCTINPGENEAVVRYALDKYSFLSLVLQNPVIGGPGLVGGLRVFDGVSFREWLREGEEHLVQRFDPSGPNDTIGFFIAKFQSDLSAEQLDL